MHVQGFVALSAASPEKCKHWQDYFSWLKSHKEQPLQSTLSLSPCCSSLDPCKRLGPPGQPSTHSCTPVMERSTLRSTENALHIVFPLQPFTLNMSRENTFSFCRSFQPVKDSPSSAISPAEVLEVSIPV